MEAGFHSSKTETIVLFLMFAILGLGSGCAPTVQSQLSAAEPSAAPSTNESAAFLADAYPLLRPGKQGQAALVYVNPTVKWSVYDKIMIEPVEFWDTSDSKISPYDQHMLTAYFYNRLKEELEKHFTIVDQGGPGVMIVQTAIVDVKGAKPGLRSVSVYVPMARLINGIQSLSTGSYAFVGSAEGELKITDSQTGELLAASADKREGGMTTETAAQRTWGDTKNVMNYWAARISERLYQLHTGKIAAQPE